MAHCAHPLVVARQYPLTNRRLETEFLMRSVGLSAFLSLFAADALASTREDQSTEFAASYIGEGWSVREGGLATGERYLDHLDVSVTTDLERAIGWRGATFFAQGVYNNGESLTDDLVGDLQAVSNIDGGGPARIHQLWLEQRFAGASVLAGLYDINGEFDTTETGGLFINGSHGMGADFGQSGANGPSIYPVTGLAVRGSVEVAEGWTVRAAVAEGDPGDVDDAPSLRLTSDEGALLVLETAYENAGGKFAVGGWRYTAEFEPISGGAPGSGNGGFYALAERKLGERLAGFVRAGVADDTFNPIKAYVGGGVSLTGPIAARPDDQIGVAIAWAELGEPFRMTEGLADREVVLEMTYRAVINDHVSLQPDVQYVFNPGGRDDDALIVGLRFELAL